MFLQDLALVSYDLQKQSQLETDALDKALRRYLTQIDKDRIPRLVAYYLQKFKKAELNYNIYDKELLAIIDCLRH